MCGLGILAHNQGLTMLCSHLLTAALISAVLLSCLPAAAEPITPKGTVALFNGRDLTNFYTWLGRPAQGQPLLGKNNDPDKVFTVHDGMIHVSGRVFGGFVAEKEYENYHLVAEFKWGTRTYPPRENKAMDSGILLHCVGEDGAAGGGAWMESVECQIIEGGTGDFILVGGKNKPSLTVECEERGGQLYYKPGGTPSTRNSGRFNWFARDPAWKDVQGFRGGHNVEKPAGEWNTIECICDRAKIINILNGTVMNIGTQSSHTKGKILFQSEGAEIFFRRIELRPLRK
jgi:hypothetical protein